MDEQQQPVGEYLENIEPLQKHKKRQMAKLVVGVLIALVGIGVTGLVVTSKRMPPPPKPQDQSSEAAAQPKLGFANETKQISSSQFSLDMEIPADWEVVDESGSGVFTATSPNVSIPAAGGGTVTGKVTLSIRDKAQKLAEFDEGNAVAVIDSEKVSYSKPSSAQRGQTYLSYLAYPATAEKELINGIYITGDFGYQKDQAIPKADIQKIDPIISLSFKACDGTCTKDIGIDASSISGEFGTAIKKILQSLTIN